MISRTPGYCPILPIETPWVLLHQRFWTKMLDVLGFGEKQSSPISMRVFVTERPLTLRESKPSVFLGSAYIVDEVWLVYGPALAEKGDTQKHS
jgi:hypothetical protein